jgi:predicted transcriptional regulator
LPNRDRDEIFALILEACQEPATRTKIMYKSLLNFHQVNSYVRVLLERHLIKQKEGTQTFRITTKGRKYLDLYNSGLRLMNTPADIAVEDAIPSGLSIPG